MKLLEKETIISETDFEHLTLTTHRVRFDQRTSDATRIVSITLDAVSSCGVASKVTLSCCCSQSSLFYSAYFC